MIVKHRSFKPFVVLDCDGTLIDSQASIIQAMNDAFYTNDMLPPSPQEIRHLVGLSLEHVITRLAPEANNAQLNALITDYKHSFSRQHTVDLKTGDLTIEPLFEGIQTLIETLYAEGIQLAIATGKSTRGLKRCLEQHKLEKYFISLQTADHHPSKPHPSMLYTAMRSCHAEPKTTWMVGDTRYDMEMAHAVGTYAIGVSWGYHTPEALRASGAQWVLDHPLELCTLINKAIS